LIIGICVTLGSTLLGFLLAWIVSRTEIPGRRAFELLNLVPFFTSPYVGAMAWQYLTAPNSGLLVHLARNWLGLDLSFLRINSIGGVIWVLVLFYTPFTYLFVIGPMRNLNGALEDAARVHGLGFIDTMRRITIPLLAPALLSGAIVVFVTSAGLFDVPVILATPYSIPTIPALIFESIGYPSDFGRASALGTLMMMVIVVLILMQRQIIGHRRFETVSGKGYAPRPAKLAPLLHFACFAVEIFYICFGAILPLIAVLLVALSPLWRGWFDPKYATLENFRYVLEEFDMTQHAILNSTFLSVLGATLIVMLGFLQAYRLQSRQGWLAKSLQPILSMPNGIPGIIFGLGILILLIRTPLYGTYWIILIAYVAHYFPFAMRSLNALLMSLSPELEQSARSCGATWWQTLRIVVIPLSRPGLIATWLMLFIILVRELGSTILLYGQGTETISVAMLLLSEQNFLYVAALAIIQVVLLSLAFAMLSRNSKSLFQ
jgi:iron(III) transport system permease protein